MALLSEADVEARIGRPLTAEEKSAFPSINEANQAYVEKLIGSSVEAVSATPRYYDGGIQHLAIAPCTDITVVKYVDEDSGAITTLDASTYTAEPINETMKTMLRKRGTRFGRGHNNVEITAKFSIYGDAKVLAIVKDALLSALENDINNTSNIAKESIEGYSIEFAKGQTKSALDKLNYIFAGL